METIKSINWFEIIKKKIETALNDFKQKRRIEKY